MTVKITRYTSPLFWYSEHTGDGQIGNTFTVEPYDEKYYEVSEGEYTGKLIYHSDCEVVERGDGDAE